VDSLREKIAQMFIVGAACERAGDDERLLFEEYLRRFYTFFGIMP